jgi:hypothetical protein
MSCKRKQFHVVECKKFGIGEFEAVGKKRFSVAKRLGIEQLS